jgi:endo-1,4-beta-xylanase
MYSIMRRKAAKLLTRRATNLGLANVIASAAAPRARASVDFALERRPALRHVTHASGIKFGCAASAPVVRPDAILLKEIAKEANIFVPEAHLKWSVTEPRPNEFDFTASDSIANFATHHQMIVHGHTLVWHDAIPDWVAKISTARDARIALERHIITLVSRYRGKIWAWDVINEPIEPNDSLDNGYRNSMWFRQLGIEYVDLAFRLARAADAKTLLSLNEYGFEYMRTESELRRRSILALLQRLRDHNTPIDCLGLQSHLVCHRVFAQKELGWFLRTVVDLGYRLMITELDVNDAEIPGSAAERDAAVARHVDEYLDIVFSVTRPLSCSTWGLTDRCTWLAHLYKRGDGEPLRPLPLDADFNRKPMWSMLAKYLGREERRRRAK